MRSVFGALRRYVARFYRKNSVLPWKCDVVEIAPVLGSQWEVVEIASGGGFLAEVVEVSS